MKVATHVSVTLIVTREYNWGGGVKLDDCKTIASNDALASIERLLESSGVQRTTDIKVKLVVVSEV